MTKQKEHNYSLETPDGKPTLWGVYNKYLDYLQDTNKWEEDSTREGHHDRLKTTILPAIQNHDQRPIGAYDRAAVDAIVETIEHMGQVRGRNAVKVPYEPKTINQFRTLIEQILEAAAEHFLCPPLEKNKTVSRRGKPKDDNLVVRRFLTPIEEADVLICILRDLLLCGEARLAIVAYDTGMRPSECCGVNWGMVRLDSETTIRKLMAAQSAVPGTNRTKLRMKTRNGHRVLLVSEMVYRQLMIVKAILLERWVAEGHSPESFDLLPLGTKGSSLTERCSNHTLSKYINRIFAEVGIRWDEMAALATELEAEAEELEACGCDVDIHEYASPCFYLLRHIFATANVPLMINVAARQYFQGHKVDDPAVSRRIFTSSTVQQMIQDKRQERPLLNPIVEKTYQLNLEQPLRAKAYEETFIIPPGLGLVAFDVDAEEPGDTITITVTSSGGLTENRQMRVWESWQDPPEEGYAKQINIQRFYHDMYRPAARRLLDAFPDLFN